jgi:hypothetical protein
LVWDGVDGFLLLVRGAPYFLSALFATHATRVSLKYLCIILYSQYIIILWKKGAISTGNKNRNYETKQRKGSQAD